MRYSSSVSSGIAEQSTWPFMEKFMACHVSINPFSVRSLVGLAQSRLSICASDEQKPPGHLRTDRICLLIRYACG